MASMTTFDQRVSQRTMQDLDHERQPRQQEVPRRRRTAKGRDRVTLAVTAVGVVLAAASAAATVIAFDWQHRRADGGAAVQTPQSAAEQQAVFLARSTLLALQHANVTEDYRVLWQLSAPAFRASNPPQRLSDIFAEYRRRRMDLSIAALSEPRWSEPPHVGADGQLRLKGFFPVAGRRLVFDLAYAPLDGVWRMTGISVSVRAEEQAQAAAPSGT
jgi:hypothetical protein